MSRSRFAALVLVFLMIFLLFPTSVISQGKSSGQKVTEGKVIEISNTFVRVGNTTIALPQKIKTLDIDGSSISFEMIRKGDYVSVWLSENGAIIKKALQPGETKTEEIVPK